MRFSASLSSLWTERDPLNRLEAAQEPGSGTVETLFDRQDDVAVAQTRAPCVAPSRRPHNDALRARPPRARRTTTSTVGTSLAKPT
jgi:hydroxypyruvate isomerase